MSRHVRSMVAASFLIATALVASGCSTGSVPSGADTADFPAKGRTITLIVPYDAGGAGDIGARMLQPYLEDELGVSVEIENKPGAGSQIGVSALSRAKPDGYTLGFTHLPATITTYLDPERQADFDLSDLSPVGMFVIDPNSFAVKGDSRFDDLDDLLEEARDNPSAVRVTDSGVLSDGHITALRLQDLGDAEFAIVHGDGGAANITNILGDNTDVGNLNISGNTAELVRSGVIKLLAIFDTERDPNYPDVKTATEQGYPIVTGSSRAISAPAGTPQQIVDAISSAMKRAMENPEFVEKAEASGLRLTYMDPAQLKEYWSTLEKDVAPLIGSGK